MEPRSPALQSGTPPPCGEGTGVGAKLTENTVPIV